MTLEKLGVKNLVTQYCKKVFKLHPLFRKIKKVGDYLHMLSQNLSSPPHPIYLVGLLILKDKARA